MKKKILLAGAVALMAAAAVTGYSVYSKSNVPDLLSANIEALADNEGPKGLMKYVCEYLGCCGGPNKCFSGEISYGGATISGTFYMQ